MMQITQTNGTSKHVEHRQIAFTKQKRVIQSLKNMYYTQILKYFCGNIFTFLPKMSIYLLCAVMIVNLTESGSARRNGFGPRTLS